MTGADQELWAAGRVSDSSESGLSGCLSYCSVLLVDLALRPVPQGGMESFLIVCTGLDLGGSIPGGLASCGIHHLIDPLVPSGRRPPTSARAPAQHTPVLPTEGRAL